MGKYANISGEWIKDLIQNFIASSPHNNMQIKEGEPAGDTALVGFASPHHGTKVSIKPIFGGQRCGERHDRSSHKF